MTILLAIDTSAGTSVALLENGVVRAEFNDAHNMKHAEGIGEAIQKVLAETFMRPSQVTEVVVGRGPGPFTGLRIGIAAGMMFAEGSGASLFGITSLDAIAFEALSNEQTRAAIEAGSQLLVTADARRGELYWALYSGRSKNGVPIRTEGPGVMKPVALDEMLAGSKVIRAENAINGASVGLLADALQRDAKLEHDLTALYLRAPDATMPKPGTVFGKKVSG